MNIVGKTTVKIHGILLCLMSVLIVTTPVSLSLFQIPKHTKNVSLHKITSLRIALFLNKPFSG